MHQNFGVFLPRFGPAGRTRLAKSHSVPPASAVKNKVFKFAVLIMRHDDKIAAAQHTRGQVAANAVFFSQRHAAFSAFYQHAADIAGASALLRDNGRNMADVFALAFDNLAQIFFFYDARPAVGGAADVFVIAAVGVMRVLQQAFELVGLELVKVKISIIAGRNQVRRGIPAGPFGALGKSARIGREDGFHGFAFI